MEENSRAARTPGLRRLVSANRGGLVLAGICFLGPSGCAAVNGYQPPASERPLPAGLARRAPAADVAVDLESHEGSPDTAVVTISLAEVVSRAREQSFLVLEAAEDVEGASGRVQTATGELLPKAALEVGGSYLGGRDINNAGAVLDDLSIPRYEPSVQIYYRVNLGAALARRAGSRHEADAMGLSAEDARRTAALQAAIGYLDVAMAYASVQITEQLVEDSRLFVTITQARAGAEIGTRADVARAEADAARAQQTLIRAQNAWERSSIRLSVLLRWPPGRRLAPSEREIRPAALLDSDRAGGLYEAARQARPDLRSAHARLEAAESQASAAWWDLLGPEIDAGARERLLGREIDDLGRTTLAHAFVRFSFGFDQLGQLRTARAAARSAKLRELALADRVRGEIETALANLRAAEAALPEAQLAAEATERSYRADFARFESGLGLGIEVIEAQNARARARNDLADAILRYNAAQMELAASIGHLSPELVGLRRSASPLAPESVAPRGAQGRDL